MRRSALPDLPIGPAVVPHAVELLPVAEGVHAHPEVLVTEHAQLPVAGQPAFIERKPYTTVLWLPAIPSEPLKGEVYILGLELL